MILRKLIYRGWGHNEVKDPPSEEGGYSYSSRSGVQPDSKTYWRFLNRRERQEKPSPKKQTPRKVRGALFYRTKCTRFLSFVKGNFGFSENISQLVLFQQVADAIFWVSAKKILRPILGFFRIFCTFAGRFHCKLLMLHDFARRKIFFANLGNVPRKFCRRCRFPSHAFADVRGVCLQDAGLLRGLVFGFLALMPLSEVATP